MLPCDKETSESYQGEMIYYISINFLHLAEIKNYGFLVSKFRPNTKKLSNNNNIIIHSQITQNLYNEYRNGGMLNMSQ